MTIFCGLINMNILLHICCSNCALYPVKLLRSEGHKLSGFWSNPNIHPLEEYNSRLTSVKALSDQWKIEMLYDKEYKPEEYFNLFDETRSDGINSSAAPSFPERCRKCYMLRLEKTADQAKNEGFDAFSTTLLISPYQNFEQIVSTGKELADKYNIIFHLNDFRPYFRDAIALSKELGLYRQKYCGCIFSKERR